MAQAFLRSANQANGARECRALPVAAPWRLPEATWDDEAALAAPLWDGSRQEGRAETRRSRRQHEGEPYGYEAVPGDAELLDMDGERAPKRLPSKRRQTRQELRVNLSQDSYVTRGSSDGSIWSSAQQEQALDTMPLSAMGWSQVCQWLVQDYRFQGAMAMLIIANAIVIGLETDHADWGCWDLIEDTFLFLFAVELVLKLMGFGLGVYFDWNSGEFNWNLFDFLIVSLGMFDFLFGLIVGGTGTGGVATVFRIIRLLRILRIFRIVKFLKQLYVLAFGFALAASAMFWVTFLMIFVLYVCSIILVRTSGNADLDDPNHDFLKRHFGSIKISMLTLFELMSSPNLQEYRKVMSQRPVIAVFLIAFIIFGSFGLVALMTGVISETMFEKNALRMEEERLKRENKRKALIRACGELFDNVGVNDRGEASRDDIQNLLPQMAHRDDIQNLLPQMSIMFDKLSIEFSQDDLQSMIHCLVPDEKGYVKREEFRRCIVQMAEGMSPLQIMELYHKTVNVNKKFVKCEAVMEDIMLNDRERAEERVDSVIEELAKRVEAISGHMRTLHKRVDGIDEQFQLKLLEHRDQPKWERQDGSGSSLAGSTLAGNTLAVPVAGGVSKRSKGARGSSSPRGPSSPKSATSASTFSLE